MKYRIEAKPLGKFKPLFAAQTVTEIEAWLVASPYVTARTYGTDGRAQKLQYSGRDLAVTELTERLSQTDADSGAVPMVWTESQAFIGLTTPVRGSATWKP